MRLPTWARVLICALPYVFMASPARADPVSAFIVSTLGSVGITVTVAAVNSFLINTAISIGLSLLGRKKSPKTGSRQASIATLSLGEAPREFLFGEEITGGSLCEAFNFGGMKGTDWEVVVIALADHPVEEFVGFYVWDKYVEFNANGIQAGFLEGLDMEFRNADPAGYTKPSRFPIGDWDPKFAGITHIWIGYSAKLVEEMGSRPTFRFRLKGAPLYDPRLDDTVTGGEGDHRWDDPSTWEWSDNPILARYMWARGIFAGGQVNDPEHLWIGRGLSAIEAPPERIIAAANLCDELVDLKAGGTEKRYRGSGVIRSDEDYTEVEQRFEDATAGSLVQREGGLELEPGAAKSVAAEITDDDLVVGEKVRFERFLSLPQRINTVVARFLDPLQKFAEIASPIRRSLADVTEDGRQSFDDVMLDFVTSGTQAQRVGEIRRRLHRLERRASLTLGPRFAQLEEGDWIGWTSARYHNGARVVYRIEQYGRAASWRKTLTLREISATAYGWDEDTDELTPGANVPVETAAPDALSLDDVTIEVVDRAGTPAIRATWTADDPAIQGVRLEVRVQGETQVAPVLTNDPAAGVIETDAGAPSDAVIEARLVPVGALGRTVEPTDWEELETPPFLADEIKDQGALATLDAVATAQIDTDAVTALNVFQAAGGPVVSDSAPSQGMSATVTVESGGSDLVVWLSGSFNFTQTCVQTVWMNVDDTDASVNRITPNNIFVGQNATGVGAGGIYGPYSIVGVASGLSAGSHTIRLWAESDTFSGASFGPTAMTIQERKR